MALLAEELVEEWLNRAGYFTIRGVKIGVHEMDLLAIRPTQDGISCRHVEVQVSVNPVSYLTRLSKPDQKLTGRAATSSKARTLEELARGADEWVAKKFGHKGKIELLARLAPGPWTKELVVHRLRHQEERQLLEERGVTIHQLDDILKVLMGKSDAIERAGGGDFLDLVFLGKVTHEMDQIVLGASDTEE